MNTGLGHELTIDRVTRQLLILCQDANFAREIETTLQKQDYQATIVKSPGQAAVTVLNRMDIDAMICDGRLGLGREEEKMFQRMRLNMDALSIPLLMVLDADDDRQWRLASKLATDEFILSPPQEDELLVRVKGLLWRKDRADIELETPEWSDVLSGFIRYVKNDLETRSETGDPASLVLVEVVGAWNLMRTGNPACDRVTDELSDYLASNLRRVDRLVRCGRTTMLVHMPGRSRELARRALQLHQKEFTQKTGSSFCLGLAVYPDDGPNFRDLILLADHALAKAWTNGTMIHNGKDATSSHSGGHQILIVDDDRFLIAPLEATFKALGYRTLRAENGRQAMHLIEHEHPDLVILDQVMPELTGFELLDRLRAQHGGQLPVPVIMLTIMTAQSDIIRGFELGVDDYIGKPFNLCELVARVERVLGSRLPFLRAGIR